MEGEECEMVEEIVVNENVGAETTKYSEEDNDLYDFDDEVDELEELKMQLEPKYAKYARWRI